MKVLESRKRFASALVRMIGAGLLLLMVCALFTGCVTRNSLTYEQMRQEYDPDADGYNYADDYDDYYFDYMGY